MENEGFDYKGGNIIFENCFIFNVFGLHFKKLSPVFLKQ